MQKIFFLLIVFPLLAFGQAAQYKMVYCPPISALTKNPTTKTWSAPGGFKSFDLSFVTSISGFLGAQWRGATVGQVTCVYKGLPEKSFNVLLVYNVISYEPMQKNWGKNLGGYRNCISHRQKQCPFVVSVKPKNEDIYQELENLKS